MGRWMDRWADNKMDQWTDHKMDQWTDRIMQRKTMGPKDRQRDRKTGRTNFENGD